MTTGTPHRASEDWVALGTGLALFILSLGLLAGVDLLGWAVATNVWTKLGAALSPASKAYAALPGYGSLLATFLFLLLLLLGGARLLGADLRKFGWGFTAVFAVSYACWVLGSWAYIAATRDKLQSFGIGWSLNLTSEAGLVIALAAGLIVGNFLPHFGEKIQG